jgi:hypothetical protein
MQFNWMAAQKAEIQQREGSRFSCTLNALTTGNKALIRTLRHGVINQVAARTAGDLKEKRRRRKKFEAKSSRPSEGLVRFAAWDK